jgi:hypothetical protein
VAASRLLAQRSQLLSGALSTIVPTAVLMRYDDGEPED